MPHSIFFVRALATLLLAAPLLVASHAGATALFEHEFVGSSTGSTTIAVGDTIAFESYITIESGTPVSAIGVSYTGDIDTAAATPLPPCDFDDNCFVGTAHQVTGWMYGEAGSRSPEDLGVSRVEGPRVEQWIEGPRPPGVDFGNSVFLAFVSLFGRNSDGSFYEGNGQRSLIGTVTVTATEAGQFNAGMLVYPGATGVFAAVSRFETDYVDVVEVESTVIPMSFVSSAYTVLPVPEPSTVLLLGGGLVGLAMAKRRERR